MNCNPYETEEYQQFVDSMVKFCRCDPEFRPCDGVLAGCPCDQINRAHSDLGDPDERFYDTR